MGDCLAPPAAHRNGRGALQPSAAVRKAHTHLLFICFCVIGAPMLPGDLHHSPYSFQPEKKICSKRSSGSKNLTSLAVLYGSSTGK